MNVHLHHPTAYWDHVYPFFDFVVLRHIDAYLYYTGRLYVSDNMMN